MGRNRSDRIVSRNTVNRVAYNHDFQRVVPSALQRTLSRRRADTDAAMKSLSDLPPAGGTSVQWDHPCRVVTVGDIAIGGRNVAWCAGPRWVESAEQLVAVGSALKSLGAKFIRARVADSSVNNERLPHGVIDRLKLLRWTADRFGLKVVSEVHDHRHLRAVADYIDVFEVHPRNSANFGLLSELGYTDKTVIINRGRKMSLEDFRIAIGYLERGRSANIILAEHSAPEYQPAAESHKERNPSSRPGTTEITNTEFQMDFSSIIQLRQHAPYPIFANCSGIACTNPKRILTIAERIAAAAISSGAHGVMIDIEPSIYGSKSNLATLLPEQLHVLMRKVEALKFTLDAMSHLDYDERS